MKRSAAFAVMLGSIPMVSGCFVESAESEMEEAEAAQIAQTLTLHDDSSALDTEIELREAELVEPVPLDRPPLCFKPLVARQVEVDIKDISTAGRALCQTFLPTSLSVCSTLPVSDQLSLIRRASFSPEGIRLPNGESAASVDVPLPSGKTAVYVTERSDLPIHYQALAEVNGQTKIVASGIAAPGHFVSTGGPTLQEQTIAAPTFPAGSSGHRIRITNYQYGSGRFLSHIYFKVWKCMEPLPPDFGL